MKKTSKILSVVLVILMVMSIIPITASATVYSGTCGKNVTWEYDNSTYTLTISGTGPMYDSVIATQPWDRDGYHFHITDIVISEGVTTIGKFMFLGHSFLTTITIPNSVTIIDDNAFDQCYSLKDVYYSGTQEQWNGITVNVGNNILLNANIHYGLLACSHQYKKVVTAPTCTEQGYSTYTCECGDTYTDNYVSALGHTEVVDNAVAPTCTSTGLTEGVHCSVCNEVIRAQETVPATGHADNDDNGYCDACDELLDPSVECNHICHEDGILGFFWKIANFFNKLFRLNPTCGCGVAHY